MIINETQKMNYLSEGFLIVPDFLNPLELNTIRKICDTSISEVENEMKGQKITHDRINVLGKKYFIKDVRKKHPELNEIIFSKKTAEVCKVTIGDTAFLHNEQFVVKMKDSSSIFNFL